MIFMVKLQDRGNRNVTYARSKPDGGPVRSWARARRQRGMRLPGRQMPCTVGLGGQCPPTGPVQRLDPEDRIPDSMLRK
jgi:hypothetical protein